MEIRPFRLSDIDFALIQTDREGWLSSRACLEAIVESQAGGCFLAEEDGRPIGMVTTTRYLQTGWIGNLVVVPEQRRRGVGTELMTRAFEHLKNTKTRSIRLEADPPGVKIYRKLGFEDVCESLRFVLPRANPGKEPPLERLTIEHLSELADFDRPRFGDNRIKFLRALHLRAAAAFWLSDAGDLAGFGMLLPTGKGTRIGPLVAVDRPAAERLVRLAISKCPGQTLSIGIPATNRAAVELCRSLAFEVRPQSLRMIWGDGHGSGDPAGIFGIASGATG